MPRNKFPPPEPKDLSYMKPAKFSRHLTLLELSREVKKDVTWLKRLEKAGRIPKAHRVKMGQNMIRLWSPEQVDEIKDILADMRVGRPSST